MQKTSYISKEKGKYCVKSRNNPDWSGGCYDTKKEAEKRLKQVEAIKHAKKADDGSVESMGKQLKDIAEYLKEAGMIADSKQLKDISYVLDSASDSDVFYVNEYDSDNAADYIPDDQANIENQGYVGGDGTAGGYSMFNVPESAIVMANLINIANLLDKKGLYEEANEIDTMLSEEEMIDLTSEPTDEELEEMARYYSEEDAALDGGSVDMLAGANGRVGTGVVDNQNAGMFQGFSDAYFYTGYGDLEGPSPVPSMPGAV